MRLLASNLRQPAAIKLAVSQLRHRIRAPLRSRALIVIRGRAHESVQHRLQGGAAVCIELTVEAKDAVEGLAQIEEAPLVRLVGVGKNAVRLEAVAQTHSRPPQAPGIALLGRGDQDRLRMGFELVTELVCRPGDQRRVPVAELALREGGLGLWEGI